MKNELVSGSLVFSQGPCMGVFYRSNEEAMRVFVFPSLSWPGISLLISSVILFPFIKVGLHISIKTNQCLICVLNSGINSRVLLEGTDAFYRGGKQAGRWKCMAEEEDSGDVQRK